MLLWGSKKVLLSRFGGPVRAATVDFEVGWPGLDTT